MRQVLFVQGGGEAVHEQWDAKLVESLTRELGPDYEIRYPRMPGEDDPRYATWKAALIKEFQALGDGAILVGHSVGATILVNVLGEERPKIEIGGLFLIAAPFIGDGGWQSDDFKPSAHLAARLGMPVFLYRGSDDTTTPSSHLDLYASAIPTAVVSRLPGRDHQLNNDLSEVARDICSLG